MKVELHPLVSLLFSRFENSKIIFRKSHITDLHQILIKIEKFLSKNYYEMPYPYLIPFSRYDLMVHFSQVWP